MEIVVYVLPPPRKGAWSSTAKLQKHFGLTKVDRIDIVKFKAGFAAGKKEVSPSTWQPPAMALSKHAGAQPTKNRNLGAFPQNSNDVIIV